MIGTVRFIDSVICS